MSPDVQPTGIALIGRADAVRTQLGKYLCDGGFDVFECEELTAPGRFAAVVVMDDGDRPLAQVRTLVQSWIGAGTPRRVVVVTPKPVSWRALALAHSECLWVLAAPAFGWQIVDALRAYTLPPPL